MDLDIDPIYCVEQVQIPPALPDVLKRFAKECIRRQPPCLHEFGVRYFQARLDQQNADSTAPQPTLQQLMKVWGEVQDMENMSPVALREICLSHGIALPAYERVFQLLDFPFDPVDPREVLILLITTTVYSFTDAMDALFKVFGYKTNAQVPTTLFFRILFFMSKRDRDIGPEVISNLKRDFAMNDWITFPDIRAHSGMKELFVDKTYW